MSTVLTTFEAIEATVNPNRTHSGAQAVSSLLNHPDTKVGEAALKANAELVTYLRTRLDRTEVALEARTKEVERLRAEVQKLQRGAQ